MQTGRRLFSFAFLAVVLVVLLGGWSNREAIYDWLRLRGYTPPAAVAQLATDTTMNPSTRRLFYVQHPDIEDKTTFNSHCRTNEQTIVLGCYIQHQGIYILNVTDSRLAGVEQVTAAHETLHAEYDLLSSQERQHIDDLLNQAYASVTDQRVRDTINAYKQSGADVPNEMHSVLGTEVRNLPPELESYYHRYFTDRAKIVDYSDQYEQVFTASKNQVDNYDQQLKRLKSQIDQNEQTLNAQAAQIDSDRAQLDSWLQQKQYDQYNAGVAPFNAKVRNYNALVTATKGLIDQYNTILAQRNSIAVETQQLYQALDSRITTQSEQQ